MGEQVKYLKCIVGETGERASYVQGNLYEVLGVDSEGHYRVETENGNKFHVPLNGGLWKFELVEESPESPKLTPRSLGCFQEVADVIGEANAVVELQKVIDSEDTIWESDGSEELLSCFEWVSSPQGYDFWDYIDDGQIPEELQTKAQPESAPVFGDVLHINGVRYVFVRVDNDGDYMATDEEGNFVFVSLDFFDEYKPNKPQELRNRILERWQSKSLDHSFDTEVCIVEIQVSSLIEFVVENLNLETGE